MPGVRSGDVAAFAVNDDDDCERVVVVVECRSQDEQVVAETRKAVAAAVQRTAGVPCEVVMAPMRSLTFTTSGKLSRAAAKQHFVEGKIRDVAEDAGYRLGTVESSPEPCAVAV